MGHYTGIRFKGVVKKCFKDDFEHAGLFGNWHLLKDKTLSGFSRVVRSDFIPCGALSYMPPEWEEDYRDENNKRLAEFAHQRHLPEEEVSFWMQVATDGFERHYNPDTGYWAFQCSLKNYATTIEEFAKLVPYFIETLEHFEVKDENSDARCYTLEELKAFDFDSGHLLSNTLSPIS